MRKISARFSFWSYALKADHPSRGVPGKAWRGGHKEPQRAKNPEKDWIAAPHLRPAMTFPIALMAAAPF
jgi:hypothetical protein